MAPSYSPAEDRGYVAYVRNPPPENQMASLPEGGVAKRAEDLVWEVSPDHEDISSKRPHRYSVYNANVS